MSEFLHSTMNMFGVLFSALQIVVWVVGLASLLFSKPPSQQDMERASMRSLSWPTEVT